MVKWERKQPVQQVGYRPVDDGPINDTTLERLQRMDRSTLLLLIDSSITKIGHLTDEFRRSGDAVFSIEAQKEALGLAQALSCLGVPSSL